MGIYKKIKMSLSGAKHEYVPIMIRQVDYLVKSTSLLTDMLSQSDHDRWDSFQREIKSCEIQGDALLSEFHEMLSGSVLLQVNKLDLQSVSMAIDDCLDAIKDTSKAVLI